MYVVSVDLEIHAKALEQEAISAVRESAEMARRISNIADGGSGPIKDHFTYILSILFR